MELYFPYKIPCVVPRTKSTRNLFVMRLQFVTIMRKVRMNVDVFDLKKT